ncbi:MAG: ChaN family lipoprotein [Desulfobacteraceae bacterium]|nr:ChaN family lipoprotein [Desulfobacteraceae bacterium]
MLNMQTFARLEDEKKSVQYDIFFCANRLSANTIFLTLPALENQPVKKKPQFHPCKTSGILCILVTLILLFFSSGCTIKPAVLKIENVKQSLPVGAVFDSAMDRPISFEELVAQLHQTDIIYIGEQHTNIHHHEIQLAVIKALQEKGLCLSLGMEMFDRTYQQKLDQWVSGNWDWQTFLKQVHWYANWRYDDSLYEGILKYAREHRIPIIGLNIASHITRKIAIGGIGSLSEDERAMLPEQIDTSRKKHRAYLESIYKMHLNMKRLKGRGSFETFYEAQCAWEDGMAQAISKNMADTKMVVIVGNGHIIHKFGIPERAFKRTGASYKTIYLASVHETVKQDIADYIWVTKPAVPARRVPK